jgi:acetyl esterase/lipase
MYFAVDPDWAALATEIGFPPQGDDVPPRDQAIEPVEMDSNAGREYQEESDAEWETSKFVDSAGYDSKLISVTARDGTEISVKVSCPNASRLKGRSLALPVLFVTHGGGYVSGSHASEEAWLLRPLYKPFDLIIISVEYRLAPENKFPVWIEDSWDVLDRLLHHSDTFVSGLAATCDLEKIVLAGSSAGGGISAALSQMCRDQGVRIFGVVLNVPMVCDYRHFPSGKTSDSYLDCNQDFMGSAHLVTCWNTLLPSATAGADPLASPLLGKLDGLPPHLIFIAGRDPLRDEGIAYAEKLEAEKVPVQCYIYSGVPHNFAHYETLRATKKFEDDIVAGFRELFNIC